MNIYDVKESWIRSKHWHHAQNVLLTRQQAKQKLIEANQALAYSLSLMQATLDSTTDGILVTDLLGNIKVFNKKILSMWGFTEQELQGSTHQQAMESVLDRLLDPAEARAQVDWIYRESPDEAHSVLEFRDGRLFERFSTVQIYEGRRVGRVWSYRDITVKSRQNEALRISEEFNRRIIENSRDCLNILTLSGHWIWISERGKTLFGWTEERPLEGRSWVDAWTCCDQEEIRQAITQAALGQESHFTGCLLVQGQERWLDVVIAPMFDAYGRPEKLLAVSRDVTERRLTEDALRRSENRFRHLADSMPQIVWAAKPDGTIDYFNQQWQECTGLASDSIITLEQWAQFVHPEDLPLCLEQWRASLATGLPFQWEYRLRSSFGHYRWQLARARPAFNERDEITRWYGSSTDIHDHKMTEEALRDETRVLECLNQTGSALISTLDLQELMEIVTDAGRTLSGGEYGAFYQVSRVNGTSTLHVQAVVGTPREGFESLGSTFVSLLLAPIFQGDVLVSRGSLRDRNYMALAVTSPGGEVLGALLFGHRDGEVFSGKAELVVRGLAAQAALAMDNARLYADVKSASLEREQLLEAERASRSAAERMNLMKDEFLATLSHELRTPMNAIQGWAEIRTLSITIK